MPRKSRPDLPSNCFVGRMFVRLPRCLSGSICMYRCCPLDLVSTASVVSSLIPKLVSRKRSISINGVFFLLSISMTQILLDGCPVITPTCCGYTGTCFFVIRSVMWFRSLLDLSHLFSSVDHFLARGVRFPERGRSVRLYFHRESKLLAIDMLRF